MKPNIIVIPPTSWPVHTEPLQKRMLNLQSISYVATGADPGFDQGGGPDHDRPKTAILGPQFCRILVLGPHFW